MLVDCLGIGIVSLIIYAFYAARGIYPGDAGDMVTAAVTHGIPHPPGYPLYTALGSLASHIPLFSLAWRVSWVSIVPHVITLILVYLLVYRLTKVRYASIFATFVLIGNYIFFLYSTTPEVFALLDCFVIAVLYIGIRLRLQWRPREFLVGCFVIGLSLTHHPLIVLMFPSFVLLVRAGFMRFHKTMTFIAGATVSFLIGLLPYVYIIGAARGSSMVNWDRPTTIDRFIRLIMRSDYGSFMSGASVGHTLYERLLNVKAYFTFVLIDYTWVGIGLALVGLLWLWKKNRDSAIAILMAYILLGPFFSFYASFPIVNRFVLGTVERFALPSYVLLAALVGIGAYVVSTFLASRIAFTHHADMKRRQLAGLFMCVFVLFPVTLIAMNMWRFWGLSTDTTTDTYAINVLESVPKRAIVILTRDTPLFTVQYMRYAVGARSDTILLHKSRMAFEDYHETLKQLYPDLIFPLSTVSPDTYLIEFIKANRNTRQIVSNSTIPVGDDWEWIPNGLVFVLISKSEVPPLDQIISENKTLWKSFQDPSKGLLARYNHLFLTNVLDEYAIASTEYGKFLLLHERFADAEIQFERSKNYGSDFQSSVAWTYVGLAESLQKRCENALSAFKQAEQPEFPPNATLLYYKAITYRDCVGDQKRADELFSQYQATDHQVEQPLER